MEEKQYEILNVPNSSPIRLAYPQNDFTRMLITNTAPVGPVTVQLYVQDPPTHPSGGAIFHVLDRVVIPQGASIEIGEVGVPYFSNNYREIYLRSTNVTGDLSILIRY